MTDRFALAEDVVCRRTNSELRMLFDKRKGVMYELNETASAVVETLERGPVEAETMYAELQAVFDVPADVLREDVDRLLTDFRDAGIVTFEG
jgi:hypothetical protein